MNPTSKLKPYNSFGIDAKALSVFIVENKQSLHQQWLKAKSDNLPVLLLGGGAMSYL